MSRSQKTELSAKERRGILDGDFPRLLGVSRFEIGQVIELTSRVSVRIEKRNLRRGKVDWEYTVIDNRDEVLRFRLPQKGKPVPAEELSRDQIAKAARQSAYDGNPRDPMDAGIVVPREVQNRLTVEARQRTAEHRANEQAEDVARDNARRVSARLKAVAVQAARSGVDATHVLARFERDLATLEKELTKVA